MSTNRPMPAPDTPDTSAEDSLQGGEVHKFLFEGQPVRGMLVRVTGAWQEMLARRAESGGYPAPVRALLGQMTAAAALMQASIKFNGAVLLQIQGDGPVALAVAEAQPDLTLRATAKVRGEVQDSDGLQALLNTHGQGRCAITLDPKDRQPGQQPYQGVVPLVDAHHQPLESLAAVLEHYMRQSEQLDTRLVLAADDHSAAGLLIQRIPVEGEGNLAGQGEAHDLDADEAFNRISHLAATLKQEELLTLDTDTILRRLFWEEDLRRFQPQGTRFGCTCSRERVGQMLQGLGRAEVEETLAEQGRLEVGCDFCGAKYLFDAIDAARLFGAEVDHPPGNSTVQ